MNVLEVLRFKKRQSKVTTVWSAGSSLNHIPQNRKLIIPLVYPTISNISGWIEYCHLYEKKVLFISFLRFWDSLGLMSKFRNNNEGNTQDTHHSAIDPTDHSNSITCSCMHELTCLRWVVLIMYFLILKFVSILYMFVHILSVFTVYVYLCVPFYMPWTYAFPPRCLVKDSESIRVPNISPPLSYLPKTPTTSPSSSLLMSVDYWLTYYY